MNTLNPQYITDADGNRISVVLPFDEYGQLLEELGQIEDVRLYDEAKKESAATSFDAYVKTGGPSNAEISAHLSKTAQKQLDKLPDVISDSLIDAIYDLADIVAIGHWKDIYN